MGNKVPDDYVVTSKNSGNTIIYVEKAVPKAVDNAFPSIQKVFDDIEQQTLHFLPQNVQHRVRNLITKYRGSTDTTICQIFRNHIENMRKSEIAHVYMKVDIPAYEFLLGKLLEQCKKFS